MTGGITVEEAGEKKIMATEVFEDATFSIHKWHSNANELEGDSRTLLESDDVSYANNSLEGEKLVGNAMEQRKRHL